MVNREWQRTWGIAHRIEEGDWTLCHDIGGLAMGDVNRAEKLKNRKVSDSLRILSTSC